METNQQFNGSAEVAAESTTAQRGTVTRDAETTALTRMLKMLDELSEPARHRVLSYIFDRYDVEGDD
jgi:hypothetical protein